MKAIFFIILCGTFSACRPSSSQKRTRSEIEGTQAERVTRATAILTKYSKLPGPLPDAHMAEDLADSSGGWVPGPSDCFLSGLITFPAADLPKWQKVLGQELAQETPKFNSCLAAPA